LIGNGTLNVNNLNLTGLLRFNGTAFASRYYVCTKPAATYTNPNWDHTGHCYYVW